MQKLYYPSGKLLEESNYIDNKLSGQQTHYFESGKTQFIKHFKENVENGEEIIYNAEGVVLERNIYEKVK